MSGSGEADREKMDSYELQCWQRALWASWTARKMTKWVPGQLKPETSQEAKMATQRRSHSGHILSGGGSLEETIMLGNLAGGRRRGRPAMRCGLRRESTGAERGC